MTAPVQIVDYRTVHNKPTERPTAACTTGRAGLASGPASGPVCPRYCCHKQHHAAFPTRAAASPSSSSAVTGTFTTQLRRGNLVRWRILECHGAAVLLGGDACNEDGAGRSGRRRLLS